MASFGCLFEQKDPKKYVGIQKLASSEATSYLISTYLKRDVKPIHNAL